MQKRDGPILKRSIKKRLIDEGRGHKTHFVSPFFVPASSPFIQNFKSSFSVSDDGFVSLKCKGKKIECGQAIDSEASSSSTLF